MAENEAFLADRLNERGLIDRWGFLVFAFGGGAAILLSKAMGIDAVVVTAGAAITMVAYAALIQLSGTGRLRSDQAGDNCYYLGLIFTLSSLAYAIFFFDPSDTATTIVQGFGIALATTVMGLILRVFFNQTRADLTETEDTARIELADAAGRLKSELSGAVVRMNDFSRETRQALEELRESVTASLLAAQQQATQTIAETVALATATISEQSTEASARAKKLSLATDKIVSGIERHADTLEGVEQSTASIATSLGALEVAATSMRSLMEELRRYADELNQVQGAIGTTGDHLQTSADQLVATLQSFDRTATGFDQNVTSRLDAVRAVPEAIAARAVAGIEEASNAIQASLSSIANAQNDIAAGMARSGEQGVAITQRHNDALELELARSRQNVEKVHTALVAMTESLVAKVTEQTT